MVYRFIDHNKEYFGLRWLCHKFGISPNGYYNYLKDTKGEYREQRKAIYERIKYLFYNNNRTIGHRAMRVFLSRYGIYLSKTTVHKYMKKTKSGVQILPTCTNLTEDSDITVASMNSDYINTELAKDTLKVALKQEKYPKNLILHSDQGQQFASWEFVVFCKEQGITQSMSKAGCPYDNAPMEARFA